MPGTGSLAPARTDDSLSYLIRYLLTAIGACAVTLTVTPLARRLGRCLGIVDRPGGRRVHTGAVSRLGGIPIFAAWMGVVAVVEWSGALTSGYNAGDFTRLRGLVLGAIGAFIFGLIDDRLELRSGPQFVFQFILSIVALTNLLLLERFTLPGVGFVALSDYSWGMWAYVPLTVLWVMGMMNTVNWLDGLDGLAAGVGAILCAVLAVHMHRVGQNSVALLPIALFGALVGFLPYNISPARIFLGSSGAFFLGYVLSALGLIAGGRVVTVLLVMGIPVVDVAWQIFDRMRHHRSPTQGDRGHLHLRLLDMGMSARIVVLLYWGLCVAFGAIALVVTSRLHKLLALSGLVAAVVTVLMSLSRSDDIK